MSGNAGSRFGWALVRDSNFATLMAEFLSLVEIHTSLDAQFKTLHVINHILDTNGELFNYIRKTMTMRWVRVNEVFSNHKRFSVVNKQSGLFYVWLKCKDTTSDCNDQILKCANLVGWSGEIFGGDYTYARVSIVMRDPTFDLTMKRFEDCNQ